MPRRRTVDPGPDAPPGLEPPATESAGNADAALLALLAAGLRVRAMENGGAPVWRISGNTMEHRSVLRDAGGRWNRMDQCWEFAGDDPSRAIAATLATRPPAIGDNSGASAQPRPHYWGHRERVRERVIGSGTGPLQDYELLELLLFYSVPRVDTKPLAKKLLERFGTLGDVLAADAERLKELDIDRQTLVHFRAVREAGLRLVRNAVVDRPVIGSWDKLLDYCRAALQHEKTEQFRVLFLDRKNVLIADEVQQRGTVDHTPVYPREVAKRALELQASSVIMVHNHPSGDPAPSREDIAMTAEVKAALAVLEIQLHDHLVIGRKGHASFRSLGLLS
jgi:DNA repair protein RadC